MIVVKEDELLVTINNQEPSFLDTDMFGAYSCPYCGAGYLVKDEGKNTWSCPSCNHTGLITSWYLDSKRYKEETEKSSTKDPIEQLKEFYHIEVESASEEQDAIKDKLHNATDIALKSSLIPFNASNQLDYFRTITDKKGYRDIKTGFTAFDNENEGFYGGLHEGLYIIGAVSSLGKTTFCFQLAEQIASKGTPVLFFSLEQSKEELLAKGISRRTYNLDRKNAKETQQILNTKRYEKYSDREKQVIKEAIEQMSVEDSQLYIFEGAINGKRRTIYNIKEAVDTFYKAYGKAPVVFVDYLQILPPISDRYTDKQNTDEAVTKLKDLSRNYHTPVIAISSFNRENYTEPVNTCSFKESGAIEYSSDVLIGLQFEGMDYEIKKEKNKQEKEIKIVESDKERKVRIYELLDKINDSKREKLAVAVEVKVLKNRNGNTFKFPMLLTHAYCCFKESENDIKRDKYEYV